MSSLLELVAVVFSGWSVWLTVKKNIWLWPTGIIGIVAFMILFYQHRLYSDTILQVVFLLQSMYGWIAWGTVEKDKTPSVFGMPEMTGSLLVCMIGSMGVGQIMAERTNAALPYWDASIMVFSVMAQALLMLKVYQNWHFWIIVDLISIGVYLYKGLYLTAVEYVVFLGMCIEGVREWRRELIHV